MTRAPSTAPASGGRARIVRWALALATVALLALLARRVDWHATAAALRAASVPLLVAAALVNIASLVVKGARWWLFLRPVGARGLWMPVRATVAGAGLNNVLVANGGDAARVLFVTRALGTSSAAVLATLAIERTWDLIGYAVLLVGAASLLPLPAEVARWRTPAAAVLVVAAVGLALLVRSAPPVGAPAADAPPHPEPSGRLPAYARSFAEALRAVSSGARFAGALALSMLAWFLQVAAYGLTAAAARAPLSPAGNVTTVLVVNLGFAVRVTPGGLGVFQALYALGATRFGMAQSTAIAVALLIQAIQILPVTLLGVALAPEFIVRRAAPVGA